MSNNSKPTTNTNYYIILALVSVLAVGVSVFFCKNLVTTILHNNKVVSAKKDADTTLDDDKTAAPKLIQSFKALSPDTLKVLHDALPTTTDFPSFITMMENLGGQSGVKLASITPDTSAANTGIGLPTTPAGPTADPTPQDYPIIISATGSFPSLLQFFANMELSARPLRITSIDLSGNNANMTANISLTTYYQGEAALPFSTRTIK